MSGGTLKLLMFTRRYTLWSPKLYLYTKPSGKTSPLWALDDPYDIRWSQEQIPFVLAMFAQSGDFLARKCLGLVLFPREGGVFERVGIFHGSMFKRMLYKGEAMLKSVIMVIPSKGTKLI